MALENLTFTVNGIPRFIPVFGVLLTSAEFYSAMISPQEYIISDNNQILNSPGAGFNNLLCVGYGESSPITYQMQSDIDETVFGSLIYFASNSNRALTVRLTLGSTVCNLRASPLSQTDRTVSLFFVRTTDNVYYPVLLDLPVGTTEQYGNVLRLAPSDTVPGWTTFTVLTSFTSSGSFTIRAADWYHAFTQEEIYTYFKSSGGSDSDPFAPGGTSEPGGGGGTFDDESDEIPDSSLPTLSAANTGFTRIYNPTLSQVQAMANYLWTDDTVIETIWNHIKQFLEDPMDAFIAFNLIPCTIPNGGTSNFKVMYIDTGVAMTTAANQFVDVDCGTVQLDRYYGSALDYTPYTRVGCFLPYIGTVELDTDEVMGATLQVKYRIDIVSGACVAKIFVDGTCLYQYSGHCAINIPFTSADFSNYVNAIIQVAKAGLIAASGVPITSAGAGEAAEQLTGRTVTTTKTTQRNPATGRQIVTGTETTERDIYSTEASFKGLSPTYLANTVGAVMGSKPMIEHSGGFNGNSGYLGIRRPFLIIKRPRMCNPSGYGTLNGYPCMIKETLGNLSGFTQVQQVQLTGLSATNPEQAEILQLLKQGVIL